VSRACNRHDLDLLIELKTNDKQRGDFQKCRDECFNAIAIVLSSPTSITSTASVPASEAVNAAAAGSSAAGAAAGLGSPGPMNLSTLAASGWEVDCKASHWLRLTHPVLSLQLDIHVSQLRLPH
jgi:hypothetical protein